MRPTTKSTRSMDVEGAPLSWQVLLFGNRQAWGYVQQFIFGGDFERLHGEVGSVRAQQHMWTAMKAVNRLAAVRHVNIRWALMKQRAVEVRWMRNVADAVDNWQLGLTLAASMQRRGSTVTVQFIAPGDAQWFIENMPALCIAFSGESLY